MKEEELLEKSNNIKDLAMGMATYSGASILGPLLLFVGLGFFVDKIFDTKPIFIIAGVFIAFITTNILIFKKIKKLIKKFDEIDEMNKQKQVSRSSQEEKVK